MTTARVAVEMSLAKTVNWGVPLALFREQPKANRRRTTLTIGIFIFAIVMVRMRRRPHAYTRTRSKEMSPSEQKLSSPVKADPELGNAISSQAELSDRDERE